MNNYDDIINLPHHVSSTRIPMPMENRAAQFAPFAALSGHDEAIAETARITAEKPELSKEELLLISRKLSYALERKAEVVVTFFLPDSQKAGGSIRKLHGKISKINQIDHLLIFDDKQKIPLENLLNIEGAIFNDLL